MIDTNDVELAKVILVEDGDDLTLYRDAAIAARALEAIDVQSGIFRAYTLAGCRIDLSTDGSVVKLAIAGDPTCRPIVRQLLERMAGHVLTATLVRHKRKPSAHSRRTLDIVNRYMESATFSGVDFSKLSDAELVEMLGFSA